MSTSDQIFFRTGLAPLEAAGRLAELLGLRLDLETPGRQVVLGQIPGTSYFSGGWVSDNYLANEPGEPSILDYYDVLWTIRSTDRREATVYAESARYFDLATRQQPWPALLLSRDSLVCVWSPEHGRYDFPARTAPDRAGMEIWLPHVPT